MLDQIAGWLSSRPLFQAISGSWGFPLFESLHVVGLAMLIGSITLMDLRLLGLTGRGRRVTDLARETLPWTWGGFALVMVTGFFLFAGAADIYVGNPAFQVKMLLLVLAGANMVVFHLFAWKGVAQWDAGVGPPAAARVAGRLSLLFWAAVVVAGRSIAFT